MAHHLAAYLDRGTCTCITMRYTNRHALVPGEGRASCSEFPGDGRTCSKSLLYGLYHQQCEVEGDCRRLTTGSQIKDWCTLENQKATTSCTSTPHLTQLRRADSNKRSCFSWYLAAPPSRVSFRFSVFSAQPVSEFFRWHSDDIFIKATAVIKH